MRTAILALPLVLTGCGLFRIFDGSGDEPPEISFEDSFAELTDTRGTDVIAHVTHDKGDDFVVSGQLLLRDGTEVAAFDHVVADQWVVALDWATLNAAETLVTEPDAQYGGRRDEILSVSLIAVFRTEKEVEGTRTLTVDVHCATGVSCDGTCVDLSEDPDNCGECGNVCSACSDGDCTDLGPCASGARHDGRTLDQVCDELVGGSCQPALFDGTSDVIVVVYGDASCQGQGDPIEDGFGGWLNCQESVSWADGAYFRPMCTQD